MPSPPLSIVQSLSPRIALLTSDDVVGSCEANGCRGLDELLRPWEGSTERVSILSSTLTPTIHPTFPLRFVNYASIFPNPAASSPNPDMVIDLISSFVGSRKPEEEQHYPLTRSLLLSSRPLASHETLNHPVGMLLAVSTATPDPLGTLGRLHGRAVGPMSQSVPWMDGLSVMKLFVVIHDVSKMGEDLTGANLLLASVKKAYGPHTTLLVINSQVERRAPPDSPDVTTHPSIPLPRPFTPEQANPSALPQVYASALSSFTLSPMTADTASMGDGPDSGTVSSPSKPARRKFYGSKLSAEDTQRLAALVRELVVQSLVPWMEARVREWNEVYQANRRGLTGRLFGAGRKLFASRPNSPAPNAAPLGYNTVKGYYPIASVEALTRRLADFAFMLRDYRFASTIYDSLRRDAAQDRAWRYSAAATEMYGLSLLLSNSYFLPSTPPTPPVSAFTTLQHTDISSWLEQSVLAYQGRAPANQIQLDALRITVLYYEAWKTIGEWRGVGYALVKSAGEADEVPSAVMIEEAAAADVAGGKSQRGRRRRAFHLVLAARRYETAGLKTYSRRCLDRAAQLYRPTAWTAAQDRIEYSLGRQAYTIGESDVAVEHFLRLLRKEDTGVPGSQGGVLEDMSLAYEQLVAHPDMLASASGKLELPTSVFDTKKTRIASASSYASTSGSSEQWADLEAQVLIKWDRKGKRPMRLLPDEKMLSAAVGETLQLELTATNPLNAPLVLSDLTVTADRPDAVSITMIPEVTLDPYETRTIEIAITNLIATTFTVTDVSFMYHRFLPCRQSLRRRGKRLHVSKTERLTPTFAADTTLTVDIGDARPQLRAELRDLPMVLYAGEEVDAVLLLTNVGKLAVDDVQLLTNGMGMIRLRDSIKDTTHDHTSASIPNIITSETPIILYQVIMQPGSKASIPITFTASIDGLFQLLGLVTYASAEDENDVAASRLAHIIHIQPLASLAASVRPAKVDSERYLVEVEVTNSSAQTFSLDNIHPISPCWTSQRPSQTLPAVVHPYQVSRTFLPLALDSRAAGDLDLLHQDTVTSLAKLVQGQADISSPPPRDSVNVIGTTSLAPEHVPSYISSRQSYRLRILREQYPSIPIQSLQRIFPLFDPLDLDLAISWSIPSTSRRGHTLLHSLRLAPEFSIVEGVRREVDTAIAKGGKQTRTMFEETGRQRRLLMDSVLEGALAMEEDPVIVRVGVGGRKRKGVVGHNFDQGACSLAVSFEIQNRSPTLSVRWVLRLPNAPDSSSQDGAQPPAPRFIGTLAHRGTLAAMSTHQAQTSIWLEEPALVSLGGWQLNVETGDEVEEGWRPRRNWSRVVEGGGLEIVHEEG